MVLTLRVLGWRAGEQAQVPPAQVELGHWELAQPWVKCWAGLAVFSE